MRVLRALYVTFLIVVAVCLPLQAQVPTATPSTQTPSQAVPAPRVKTPHQDTIVLPTERDDSLTLADANRVGAAVTVAKTYWFIVTAGEQLVTLRLRSNEFDTYLVVRYPGDTLEARNDDYPGDGTNSGLTLRLAAGAYRIVATSYEGISLGRFQISLQPESQVQLATAPSRPAIAEQEPARARAPGGAGSPSQAPNSAQGRSQSGAGGQGQAGAAAQEPKMDVPNWPSSARVGTIVADAPEVSVMIGSIGIDGAQVRIASATDGDWVTGGVVKTNARGLAFFDSLTVNGAAGKARLSISSDVTDAKPIQMDIDVLPGLSPSIVVIRQPSARIAADTPLVVQPVVRVVDQQSNAIPHAEVEASLCELPAKKGVDTTFGGCVPGSRAELQGTTVLRADENGQVQFTDLAVVGFRGTYRLRFAPLGDRNPSHGTYSTRMWYDPEHESNRSHVVISAIKSIAGQVPRDEFFDVRFRYRYGGRFFSLASFDVALNAVNTDSVKSNQQFLTEADGSLCYTLFTTADTLTSLYERAAFIGPRIRVFNTLPYYGIQVGSEEQSRSAFQGSMISVGVLHRMNDTVNIVGVDTIRAYQWNLSADVFLRSSTVAFFKTLNLRVGVLIPIAKSAKIQSRITIAVPVGTIEFF